jgi:hypothetical protein
MRPETTDHGPQTTDKGPSQAVTRRPRWSVEEHRKWIRKTFGRKVFVNSDDRLSGARADRRDGMICADISCRT